MFKTIINAWKIADLRKKMLFTALIVFIFRLGAALPVPFVNISGGLISDQNANNFMTYLSMMTGDAFNYGTLFAMSITPYINASIIIELLTVAIPALERLAKEGEEGRKKISTITRYSSVVLALMQSTAYYFYIRSQNYLSLDADGNKFTGFFAVLHCRCFTHYVARRADQRKGYRQRYFNNPFRRYRFKNAYHVIQPLLLYG